jgi:chromosome segregation ATPase
VDEKMISSMIPKTLASKIVLSLVTVFVVFLASNLSSIIFNKYNVSMSSRVINDILPLKSRSYEIENNLNKLTIELKEFIDSTQFSDADVEQLSKKKKYLTDVLADLDAGSWVAAKENIDFIKQQIVGLDTKISELVKIHAKYVEYILKLGGHSDLLTNYINELYVAHTKTVNKIKEFVKYELGLEGEINFADSQIEKITTLYHSNDQVLQSHLDELNELNKMMYQWLAKLDKAPDSDKAALLQRIEDRFFIKLAISL